MKRVLSVLAPLFVILVAVSPSARAQDVLDDGSAPLPDDVGVYAPPAVEDVGPGGGHATAPEPQFVGAHPLESGGYCYERGVHVHGAMPSDAMAPYYRDCGGASCFVGDPLPFGYLGNVTAYDGYHPLMLVQAQSYCFLRGFHYHVFAPSQDWSAWYAFFSGAWGYRGATTVAYQRDREKYEREEPTYTALPGHRRSIRNSLKHYTKAARSRLRATRGRVFVGNRRAALAARGPATAARGARRGTMSRSQGAKRAAPLRRGGGGASSGARR